MFADLESAQTELGISSFGVSTSTMEEVFLRVNDLAQHRFSQQHEHDTVGIKELDENDPTLLRIIAPNRLRGLPYHWQHFEAMFIKKAIYFYRNWIMSLSYLLVPIVYMALAAKTTTLTPSASEQPSLKIDFSPFSGLDSHVFILVSNNTDISEYGPLMF
ncbi:hypothetical protein Y032_0546g3256 [Ancylostoma ceylanicum]|uniref:Uncharacterized protein n=1 Tax=Ancylostoma ceylanicum TaxID=53326 RepID=A0A016WR26_9BILA|nr:hypothetical protein Y032_0546g3256 [Ancylostoma ceylanicum]